MPVWKQLLPVFFAIEERYMKPVKKVQKDDIMWNNAITGVKNVQKTVEIH